MRLNQPPPKVILYGDSLSMESVKFFSWFVSQGGHRAVEVGARHVDVDLQHHVDDRQRGSMLRRNGR